MSTITKEQLEEEVGVILNGADLSEMSLKKVRGELEKTFRCDLTNRWLEIREIVVDEIMQSSWESEPEAEPEPAPKTTGDKKKADDNFEEAASDPDSEEDQPKKATRAKGKKRVGRRRKCSDSDSDWNCRKKAKKTTKGAGTGISRNLTRTYTLSADLASLMGAESLSRTEVVNRMWDLIEERNLFDPENIQFAICDSDLLKVIGVKRFRTFHMSRYLRPHFINSNLTANEPHRYTK